MIVALVELLLRAVGFGVVCTSVYVVAVSLFRFRGDSHAIDKTQPSYKRIKTQMESQKSTQSHIKGI